MSHDTPIPLVPGDDWSFDIATLDQDGAPIDLTGFTVLKRSLTSGAVAFDVDVAFSPGVARITAAHAVTTALKMGNVSTLTIKVQSPDATWTTVIVKPINGVRIRQAFEATATLLGVQGPRGAMMLSGDGAPASGLGKDGDTYIDRVTGEIWEKAAGAWADTGANIYGANLEEIAAAREAAVAAAAATALDRLATSADVQQTGLDRIATGEDRTATGQDRTQTGLDRAATGQDKQATAADRVQTGLDRAGTSGDALSTAADVAVANAAKDASLAYELLTAGLKAGVDTTYAAMIAALAGVTNYDNTLGQLTGAAKQIVAAADVVAAIVYDTAKDSDGGVWRWRARGSWFYEPLNTASRGSRQFFPKRTLIVARTASVTIYDLDDRACPMWMVFARGSAASKAMIGTANNEAIMSIHALNGGIYVGTQEATVSASGCYLLDFIADKRRRWMMSGFGGPYDRFGIADRNVSDTTGAKEVVAPDSTSLLVSGKVNAVAATILPGTPIDPLRKLPTPTVAIATAAGVSVIHWDGRVTNSFETTIFKKVSFGPGYLLMTTGGSYFGGQVSTFAEIQTTGFGSVSNTRIYNSAQVNKSWPKPRAATFANDFIATDRKIFHAGTLGLGVLDVQSLVRSGIAWADINTQYNTGYMVGDIAMALAESVADVTSLVGATPLFDDFSTYADTAAMLAAGWVGVNNGDPTLSAASLRVTNGAALFGRASRAISTVVGRRYTVKVDIIGPTTASLYVGTTAGASNIASISGAAGGAASLSFVATVTTTYISVQNGSSVLGNFNEYDNFAVRLVASDRSVAGNHPVVVGTITRAAVAAGAELAAYSGFSASNRLESAYSSAFDFGTGDLCLAAWVKGTGGGTIIHRQDVGASGARIGIDASGNTARIIWGASSALSATTNIYDGAWHLVVGLRRSGVFEIWVDGRREGTLSSATDVSNATAPLAIGARPDTTIPYTTGSIALPRVSATAPTPAQIRAMYAAELPMFQAGAKCLLAGSDNVQALSYDDGTDLLYAAKAAGGTDVFKGLVRQGSITMASENALGPEKVANGGFDTDTVWTKGVGWSISGGVATAAGAVSGQNLGQSAIVEAGKTYLVEATFTITSGSVRMLLTGAGGATRTTSGTYIDILTPVGGTNLAIQPQTAFTGTVDNVSIREITSLRLASNNHKGVSASNDNIAIITDADVYQKTPSISLREAVDTAIGRTASAAPYNRNVVERPGCAVTSNATPTVIASLPMDKGEAGDWVIETVSREYGDPASQEFGLFRDHFYAARPGEGNIALSGASTQTIIRRVTATQAVTIQVNTTTQCIEVLATGVAAKNLEWGVKAVFFPVAQVA